MNIKILKVKNRILDLVDKYSKLNFKYKKFILGTAEILDSGKVIESLEIKNLVEAFLDRWLTTGRFNKNLKIPTS